MTVDGDAMIVGVEGGDAPAFAAAPHYDPKALAGGRIIIADLDVGTDLPRGRTRVATLHMRESGAPPTYHVALQAAANADGSPHPRHRPPRTRTRRPRMTRRLVTLIVLAG